MAKRGWRGAEWARRALSSAQRETETPKQQIMQLNVPTALTLARVAAVPAVAVAHLTGSASASASLALAASLTDYLDGALARKLEQRTRFGAFLDPVADKLMVTTALVCSCAHPPPLPPFASAGFHWLLPSTSVAIICREIAMSALREFAASSPSSSGPNSLSVNALGKAKTASQMVSCVLLLALRNGSDVAPLALSYSAALLLATSAISSWASFGIYFATAVGNIRSSAGR